MMSCARLLRVATGAREALGREPDADEPIRGATQAAPETAELTSPGVVVLAGLCLPGAGTVRGATDLHRARPGKAMTDAPVEAVPAHVDEAPSASEIPLQPVQHRRTEVLGMGAGHDDPVAREEFPALRVKQLVG